jgi:predicted DNA-binding transcriptional regulator AlpA
MEMLKFENLPTAVAELLKGQSELRALLLQKAENHPKVETPITDGIKGVSTLIGKTVPTIYSYCQRNLIPHAKQGNRLIFFESEIIAWLKSGKIKTNEEMEAEATNYVSNHKKAVIKRENQHYNGSEVDNSIIKLNK